MEQVSSAVVTAAGDEGPPTRRMLFLRREAANRARARGEQAARRPEPLPPIAAGSCEGCGGWGEVGRARVRCSRCRGTGG